MSQRARKTARKIKRRSPALSGEPIAGRSPLAQLLHALNQPLTGLQCAMEVALAAPRTPEQYVEGLRTGLQLTARMRDLVHAIREVTESEGEVAEGGEARLGELMSTDMEILLRETIDELKPVAETNGVRIRFEPSVKLSLTVRAQRARLAILTFQLLESALSLAADGTELQIEMGRVGASASVPASAVASAEAWLRIAWRARPGMAELSHAELGLLAAQAGWQRAGADWQRPRGEDLDTITLRFRNPVPDGGWRARKIGRAD